MSRIIKFRAKDKECGHWTVGFIYEHKSPLQCFGGSGAKSTWWIHKTGSADWSMPRPVDQIEVDPETVGQFTGFLDKNGKEIYEGDICLFCWNPILNQPGTIFKFRLPVEYYTGWGCYVFHIESNKMKKKQRDMFTDYGMEHRYLAIGTPMMYNEEGGGVEIVGNIYENQELLK